MFYLILHKLKILNILFKNTHTDKIAIKIIEVIERLKIIFKKNNINMHKIVPTV